MDVVKRGMASRVVCAIAWWLLIVLVIELIIAVIVGAVVTDGHMTHEEAWAAGVVAEEAITPKYWWVILSGQTAVWLVLLRLGKLRGTTRLKSRRTFLPR